MGHALFKNRVHAGRMLVGALQRYRSLDLVIYGLPRGGVILAKEVADALGAPLDLVFTHKLAHPKSPEFAIGAVTEEGEVMLEEALAADISPDYIEEEKRKRIQEAKARHHKYLGNRAPITQEGKTAIIVDDGLATGYTMKAAILALRKRNPLRIVVAAPVGPPEVFEEFQNHADDVVVPYAPPDFYAVGAYYSDFAPVTDEEVIEALRGVAP